jgi:3-hydroxyacyl-CoA dehydrogenase
LAKARNEQVAYPAAAAIVEAGGGVDLSFAEGEVVEARLFATLLVSRQSRALRHLFFAQRAAGKIPGCRRTSSCRR